MKVLLTNDDGYQALGINTLYQFFPEATIIAPDQERSSCGHGISLATPIRLTQQHEKVFSCSGLPADCVLIGVGHLAKPELVISGINHGANLGQDRYYSGTMAAAREAAFRGIPSISVSLVTKPDDREQYFETAARFVRRLVDKGISDFIPPMHLLNINVPNRTEESIAGVKLTKVGFQRYSEEVIERVDARGKNYYWIGGNYQGHQDISGSDCNAVADGFISLDLQALNQAEQRQDDLSDFLDSL
jgi:5'-nucleotidase